MNLSKRLKTVADCVTPGNVVADVGTDHGYIPIYLAAHGISPHVIAMDVNEGPLSTAGRNISLNNVENLVSTRLSDGLKELGPNEADTVIISGMGGLLTVRILKDDMDKVRSLKELILSPHSDWDVVRHFLHDEGMMITDEHMVIDDGKYYVVMKAVYRPEISRNPGECEYRYGCMLLASRDPVLKQYLENELSKKITILKGLDSQKSRIEELKSDIDIIKEGLHLYEC